MTRPVFIIIEGGECTGKSTQMELLLQAFRNAGMDVIKTHEPGGTAVGEKIREILIGEGSPNMSSRTELFLFLAARSAWIEDVVNPAINRGTVVVGDRSYPSTFVYQGYAGDISLETIEQMNDIVMGDKKPDLVIIIDISPKTMRERMIVRSEGEDRIEAKGGEFHAKVLLGYRRFAQDNTDGNVVLISGEDDIARVHRLIIDTINTKLNLRLEIVPMNL